jgi:hypothetical protein
MWLVGLPLEIIKNSKIINIAISLIISLLECRNLKAAGLREGYSVQRCKSGLHLISLG